MVGISPDKPEKLAKFVAKEALTYPLLSDVDKEVLTAYGAFGEKRLYGKTVAVSYTHLDVYKRQISDFLGMADTILFSSCFDANGGVFEVLFDEQDAIVSDELNHASLIDGIRLAKAARYRYRNRDMDDLRAQLEAARAAGARQICVVTDGVFSMDGYYACLLYTSRCV